MLPPSHQACLQQVDPVKSEVVSAPSAPAETPSTAPENTAEESLPSLPPTTALPEFGVADDDDQEDNEEDWDADDD